MRRTPNIYRESHEQLKLDKFWYPKVCKWLPEKFGNVERPKPCVRDPQISQGVNTEMQDGQLQSKSWFHKKM